MEHTSKRYLICNGDANSYRTHGGLPYNLFKVANNYGFIDNAISLNYKKLRYWKSIWNFLQILKYGKPGGFQWSEFYSKKICNQIKISSNEKVNILSIYPLLPYYPWPANWNIDFYIDATTTQIFNEYFFSNLIHESYREKIIYRERLNYTKAKKIICRSDWAAKSLINDYQIEENKISIVPGGANLDLKKIDKKDLCYVPERPSAQNPVIIGFLGLDWNRKGGDFLTKLADTFLENNVPIEIRVVGPKSNNLPSHPSLRYVGFIDKYLNLDLFVNELRSWHFGSLFSKAEAFGISNRECMLLGVPVICHNVGGISSTLPESNFGMIFEANPNPLIVFNWIMDTFNPYEKYILLRRELSKKHNEFTWDRAIKNLSEILI